MVDFRAIRPIRGTQHNGFEELCCQLAGAESVPGAQFVRNGTPDGGVECYWTRLDGTEWGFQAKYHFDIGSSQWVQMDHSVERALSTHPRLTRFTFCLPINLPDARDPKQKSLRKWWQERVLKWTQAAAARGLVVEFDLWDETQLLSRLGRAEHAGRRWFWFRAAELSPEWVRDHVNEALAGAGPRYTPEAHVELPLALRLDILGHAPAFRERLLRLVAALGDAAPGVSGRASPPESDVGGGMFAGADELRAALDGLCHDPPSAPRQPIERLLRDCLQTARRAFTEARLGRPGSGPSEYDRYRAERYMSVLDDVQELHDAGLDLATRPALLVTGDAGAGKSHLLCDAAARRAQAGEATLVLLGQQFGGGDVWDQLIRRGLRLDCTREELLGALGSAAEACGGRALILIDAINEATEIDWLDELPRILEVVARYPRVGLAVTCRTGHAGLLVRGDLVPGRMGRTEHAGFEGRAFDAVAAFCRHYGIETLNAPPLAPEFLNPLFLKLYCAGLSGRRLTRPPLGHCGLQAVFGFLLDAVNERLGRRQVLDFDAAARPVHRAVEAVADAMLAAGLDRLPRNAAAEVLEKILPSRGGHSRSLLWHLLAEGVLADDVFRGQGQDESARVVRFAYERQADFALVSRLLDRHLDPAEPAAAFASGPLAGWFGAERGATLRRRFLPALVTLVAERTGRELNQLVPHAAGWNALVRAELEALPLRASEHVTPEAVARIDLRLADGPHGSANASVVDAVYDRVLQLVASPGHPLNADWLHARLLGMAMPDRDRDWSIYLHRAWESGGAEGRTALGRLLGWAWPADAEDRDPAAGYDEEVVRLAAVALAWCLTTPHRFVRDRATKALVALLRSRLDVLGRVVEAFRAVDDLYLLERLYAACYGCALRSSDAPAVGRLAQRVFDAVFAGGSPPANVLLRDHARGVVECALHLGCRIAGDVALARPPYRGDPPPGDAPAWEELDCRGREPGYYSLLSSLAPGEGDFARYILASDSVVRGLQAWTDRPDPFAELRRLDTARVDLPPDLAARWWAARFPNFSGLWLRVGAPPDGQDDPDADDELPPPPADDDDDQVVARFAESLPPHERDAFGRYLEAEDAYERERRAVGEARPDLIMDRDFPCRWIFGRVLELGWTPERFAEFDGEADAGHFRDARKPERVGKKYQWLAYHELAAWVFDRRPLKHDASDGTTRYEGPWQEGFRQIDPSCLLAAPAPDWDGRACWWAPLPDPLGPAEGMTDEEWVRDLASVPDAAQVLSVCGPDGRDWLGLRASVGWEQTAGDRARLRRRSRREVSFTVASVVVRAGNLDRFSTGMATRDWTGMDADAVDVCEQFLGEYGWAPSFGAFAQDAASELEAGVGENSLVGRVSGVDVPAVPTAMRYLGGANGYDCSHADSSAPGGYMPSVWLARRLGLRWAGRRFDFAGPDGLVAAFDPSHTTAGPVGLLADRRSLVALLDRAGLALVWLVVGEKHILDLDLAMRGDTSRLVFRCRYSLGGDGVIRLLGRRSTLLSQSEDVELEPGS